MLIAVVIGIVYLPLNMLLLKIGEKYQSKSLRLSSPIEYWLVRILIFPLWAVVAILSIPYEAMVESAH